MTKPDNKRKNPVTNSSEEKAPQKKQFASDKKSFGSKSQKDQKHSNDKKPFKKDFKPKAVGDAEKPKQPEFKPYVKKSQLNADGSKKDLKSKQKFDKKTRIFGASSSSKNEGGEDNNQEGGILFTEINQKINKIQNVSTSQDLKERLIEEIISKMSGVLKLIVHKRDGSRAVQACLKNGNDGQKEKIFNILFDSKELDDIIKSKYGHYVALKMIKFMKTKASKERFFEVLLKNAFYLVTHVEGAKVLDKFVVNIATPSQFNQLKKLFTTKLENAASLKQEETIENIAAKLIDKANHQPLLSKHILSLSLPILIPAEREKTIEFLREKIIDLVDSKEGIRLALDVINYSSPKDKKLIVKGLKDHIVEIINSQSSQAFLIIIKLITSWDDTVQTNKQILSEIRPALETLLPTKNGIAFFFTLFQPKHNNLVSLEKEVKFSMSKKSSEQRLSEIIEYILEDVVKAVPNIPEEQLYKDFSTTRFLTGLIRHILLHKREKHYEFAFSTIDKLIESGRNFLKNNDKKEQFNEECLLSHRDSHRILKNIIVVSKEITDEMTQKEISQRLSSLTDLLVANLPIIIASRATYLLVALIENNINKTKVVDAIKKHKSLLQKQGEDNKGAALLKTLIA